MTVANTLEKIYSSVIPFKFEMRFVKNLLFTHFFVSLYVIQSADLPGGYIFYG